MIVLFAFYYVKILLNVCFFVHEDFFKGLREKNKQELKIILETAQKYLFPHAKYLPGKLF